MVQSIGSPLVVGVFLAIIGALLVVDLGVFNRKAHVIRGREALLWSAFFIALSLSFAVWLAVVHGRQPALEFLTGYLIEYALSVDNLFVFIVIFNYFRVPAEFQHRVLFWGILGALLLRAVFILLGAALLAQFHWVIYIFGAFLVVTGIRLLVKEETEIDPSHNPVLRLFRRLFPITPGYQGARFLVSIDGRRFATPLLLVLVVVEATDVVFAVDSIPAIFGVTRDPFIVFTSNIFAILGLRALYFLLASVLHRFHYLNYGLGLVLAFVGAKMLLSEIYPIPIGVSLGVVAALLGGSILVSWLFPPRGPMLHEPPPATLGEPPPFGEGPPGIETPVAISPEGRGPGERR